MLAEPATHKLHENITIRHAYENEFFSVDPETRVVTAKRWCAWDGATSFPDFKWILEGSLWHDILHWLIAKGVIPEEENDLIDKELAHIIKELGGPSARGKIKEILLSFRARYVQLGTNTADEKVGSVIPIYKLDHGKMERIN
jgi:hypothetical protein